MLVPELIVLLGFLDKDTVEKLLFEAADTLGRRVAMLRFVAVLFVHCYHVSSTSLFLGLLRI